MIKLATKYILHEKEFDALMIALELGIKNLEYYTKENEIKDDKMLDSFKDIKERILNDSILNIEEKAIYIDLIDYELFDIRYAFYMYVLGTYEYFVEKPIISFQDMIKKNTTEKTE